VSLCGKRKICWIVANSQINSGNCPFVNVNCIGMFVRSHEKHRTYDNDILIRLTIIKLKYFLVKNYVIYTVLLFSMYKTLRTTFSLLTSQRVPHKTIEYHDRKYLHAQCLPTISHEQKLCSLKGNMKTYENKSQTRLEENEEKRNVTFRLLDDCLMH